MDDTANVRDWDALRRNQAALFALVVFAGVFVVLWGYHGCLAVLDGRWLYALFYLPAALGWAAAAALTIAVVRLRSPRLSLSRSAWRYVPGRGVTMPASRAVVVCTAAVLGCTAFSGAVFAVGSWTGQLIFPMSSGQRGVFPYVAAALSLYSAGMLVWALVGGIRPPSIECTPKSLTVNGFRNFQAIAWTDVATIIPVTTGKNAAIEVVLRDDSRAEVSVRTSGTSGPQSARVQQPMAARNVDLLGVGAHRLLEFLRFYVAHPDARDELADTRAGERLQTL